MLRAIVLMGVLLAVGVTTQSAKAQSRAALCESESDAEQVFAYLQIAVEAGDRAGASACADAYLELAPRGAHVREANELVASMLYRPDLSPLASQPELPRPVVDQSQDTTGWLVLGVSGAFVVAGVALLGVAASDAAAVEQSTLMVPENLRRIVPENLRLLLERSARDVVDDFDDDGRYGDGAWD